MSTHSSADAVFDEAAVKALASIDDEDLEVGVLVQDLLYSAIVAAFPWKLTRLLLLAVLCLVVVTEVAGLRAEVGLSVGLRGGRLVGICVVKSATACRKRGAHN
jgi:hypothetical protein